MIRRHAAVAGLTLILAIAAAGCDRNKLDKKIWAYSGSDLERGIDHYYSKPSVKKQTEGGFTVTTKLVPTKKKDAVAEATGVKNAASVEVKMEVGCKERFVRVTEKDYRDADGISLLVEKEEMKMDAVRPVNDKMPLFRMFQEVCR